MLHNRLQLKLPIFTDVITVVAIPKMRMPLGREPALSGVSALVGLFLSSFASAPPEVLAPPNIVQHVVVEHLREAISILKPRQKFLGDWDRCCRFGVNQPHQGQSSKRPFRKGLSG